MHLSAGDLLRAEINSGNENGYVGGASNLTYVSMLKSFHFLIELFLGHTTIVSLVIVFFLLNFYPIWMHERNRSENTVSGAHCGV